NEFCERFSYYGMKAVLTLYFLSYLKWDKDLSTAIYHAFSGLCYFTPILGAVIADSWLGKFKTIIYLSIVYVIGHVVKSVGAIPTVGNTDAHIALSMVGLILIALGTGGIKPCVAAFGGDQFEEEHVSERQKFFSIFYMSINAGSVLSTLITPILRGDVQCFGDDCYALAFGVPAALMVVALAVFIFGSGMYKKTPPQGNVLGDVCKCIGFAIKNRWKNSKHDLKRTHWLDWAEDKYPKRLIQEIKMVLRVLVLYIPLPMFWALFDQQGSRWTLQATRMNMAFVRLSFHHLNMLNALLILIFVPIFDLIIYPLVGLCRINITPLRKMAAGMIFAALAFGAATLVEVNVVKTVVEPAPAGQCLLQVFNLAEGDVSVRVAGSDLFQDPIPKLQDPPAYESLPLGAPSKDLSVNVTLTGNTYHCSQAFEERKAYSLIIYRENTGVKCKLVSAKLKVSNELSWFTLNSFLNTRPEAVNITVGETGFYPISECFHIRCRNNNVFCNMTDLSVRLPWQEAGKTVAKAMEDVTANNVHIAWQIPQYVLITAGEVMFSITGLEFSYSQAPNNMKSVLQAGWLLTVAFGNVIVLIVAEGAGLEQWIEFLLFGGLLLAVCIIFSIMACFYTYVDPEELKKMYSDDYGKEEDDGDMKKKNPDVPLNKVERKSTRL
uniref:Solute carrier family 15 member 2 n=1 Tax=Fundulus heteroclitus TaxID=8078 RepID=A0A3Q2QRX4_FUNHE